MSDATTDRKREREEHAEVGDEALRKSARKRGTQEVRFDDLISIAATACRALNPFDRQTGALDLLPIAQDELPERMRQMECPNDDGEWYGEDLRQACRRELHRIDVFSHKEPADYTEKEAKELLIAAVVADHRPIAGTLLQHNRHADARTEFDVILGSPATKPAPNLACWAALLGRIDMLGTMLAHRRGETIEALRTPLYLHWPPTSGSYDLPGECCVRELIHAIHSVARGEELWNKRNIDRDEMFNDDDIGSRFRDLVDTYAAVLKLLPTERPATPQLPAAVAYLRNNCKRLRELHAAAARSPAGPPPYKIVFRSS